MHVIVSTKWLVLIVKKRADNHNVVICTCTKFYFCIKHKITSVPKNSLFLTELVSYKVLILLNLAEFIGWVFQTYVLATMKANNCDKGKLTIFVHISLTCLWIWDSRLVLLFKTSFLRFLVHYDSNSPRILVILPAFFSFLDPLLFIFPFLFCVWCTCISPLVSAFVLLMSAIKFWPVKLLINFGVFPTFHFYIFNCSQAFLLGSEKLVSDDMDGLRHRLFCYRISLFPGQRLPVSRQEFFYGDTW